MLSHPVTGVQRYTREVLSRIESGIDLIRPRAPLAGMKAHLWEQAILPGRLSGRLLWSPANTGPLLVRRQVLTVHDMSVFDVPHGHSAAFSQWYKALLPRLLRRVAHVMTDSEFSRRRIEAFVPDVAGRITVVPLGVNSHFVRAPMDDIRRVAARLQIPSARFVTCLASVEPRKNLPLLLESWRLLLSRLPEDWWLVVAGDTGRPEVFGRSNLGNLPPRVWLTGRVEEGDVPALISGSRVFVYPSLYEGFGLPPLEAMACGTPVIVSDAEALKEVVGDAGLVVGRTNPEELAGAILKVCQDDRLAEKLKGSGHARAKQFSWDRTAEMVVAILTRASEARTRRLPS